MWLCPFRLRLGPAPPMLMLFAVLAGAAGCAGVEHETALIRLHLMLDSNATVADIGAGDGDYAFALARVLGPEARVIATELDPDLVRHLQARAAATDNVSVVQAGVTRTGLEAGCCSAIFMRNVYHHLTDPQPLLADLYQALRPGGRLLIIDFLPSRWLAPWTPEGLPSDRTGHGIDPVIVTAEAGAAGFVTEQHIEDWPSGPFTDLFGLVLRKPVEASP